MGRSRSEPRAWSAEPEIRAGKVPEPRDRQVYRRESRRPPWRGRSKVDCLWRRVEMAGGGQGGGQGAVLSVGALRINVNKRNTRANPCRLRHRDPYPGSGL